MTSALPPLVAEVDIVERYGSLIDNLVRRFTRHDSLLEYDDLYQVACVAFVEAHRNYDPDKINPETGTSYAFSAYAGKAAHSQMKRYAERQAKVGVKHVPENVYLRRSVKSLDSGPILTGVGSDEAIETFSGPSLVSRALAVEDAEDDFDSRERIWQTAERVLSHRHYWVLWSMYARGRTMTELGRWLGLTKMRISQLHREAVDKLRPHLTEFANG